MRIPKAVKIKGRTWTVSFVKGLKLDGEIVTGLTDTEALTIQIEASLSKRNKVWVFWHEYFHAFLFETGTTRSAGALSGKLEEILCDFFADMITEDKTVSFKKEIK